MYHTVASRHAAFSVVKIHVDYNFLSVCVFF